MREIECNPEKTHIPEKKGMGSSGCKMKGPERPGWLRRRPYLLCIMIRSFSFGLRSQIVLRLFHEALQEVVNRSGIVPLVIPVVSSISI